MHDKAVPQTHDDLIFTSSGCNTCMSALAKNSYWCFGYHVYGRPVFSMKRRLSTQLLQVTAKLSAYLSFQARRN